MLLRPGHGLSPLAAALWLRLAALLAEDGARLLTEDDLFLIEE